MKHKEIFVELDSRFTEQTLSYPWLPLCAWLIRNLPNLWWFRSRKEHEPLAGYLITAFAERFSVNHVDLSSGN